MSSETRLGHKPILRRAVAIGAQVLLILVTAGLIYAIWMPAIEGVSEKKQKQNEREDRRLAR